MGTGRLLAFRQMHRNTRIAPVDLQFAQRFDQLELHVRRQTADVVVGLDDVHLAGLAAGRFDHCHSLRLGVVRVTVP